MTEPTPLIRALAGIYPALGPTQIDDLAATVDRLAHRMLVAPPWVAATLKQARIDAELTQAQVAAHMDWSPSKMIRIENGAVGISHNDLLALIELYRIRDADVVKRLVDESYGRRRAIRQPMSLRKASPVAVGGVTEESG